MQNPSALRRCGRCGAEKPLDHFAWRKKANGLRDNYCRPCRAAYKREHYAANKERYVAQARSRKKAIARERAAYLVRYFADNHCVDCGEDDPIVLEFDHLGAKRFSIARGLRDRSWEALLEEMAKCEVVCANCHRRRTASRAGFARLQALEELLDGPSDRSPDPDARH